MRSGTDFPLATTKLWCSGGPSWLSIWMCQTLAAGAVSVVGTHRTWAATTLTIVLLSGAFGIGVTLTMATVGRGTAEAEATVDGPGEAVTLTAPADAVAEKPELDGPPLSRR